jgi:hypothetical protein
VVATQKQFVKTAPFFEQALELSEDEAVQPLFFGVSAADRCVHVEGVVVKVDEEPGRVLAQVADGFLGHLSSVVKQGQKDVLRRLAYG